MTEPVTIVLLGRPVPWAHKNAARSGVRYTPAKQRANAETLATVAQQEMRGREMLTDAVTIEILAEMPIPKSWSRRKRDKALVGEIRHTKKPDGSNIQKQVEDALRGVVYRDDALIDEWHGRKVYGLQPKLVVTVSPVETRYEWNPRL
jgi:Holliday junction resolvase RusA-like endonuclease